MQSSTSTILRYEMTVTVSGGSDTNDLRFVIDSLVEVEGADFDRTQVAAARGTVFEAHLLPTGRVSDLDEAGMNQPLLNRIHTLLTQFFPIIPNSGLQPGAFWTDTTTSTRKNGQTEVQIDAIVESHAGGWEPGDNGVTLAIDWRATYTLTGEGEQLGRHFTIAGKGATAGRSRVSGQGVFLGTLSSDSSSAEVLVQDLGYPIPVVQSGADTVSLIR